MKAQASALAVIAVLLLGLQIHPDSIHFYPGDDTSLEQTWAGRIVSIKGDHLVIEFSHGVRSEIHKIHISRILRLEFNGNYQHSYAINLHPRIAGPLPGDTTKLRKIYLYHDKEDLNEFNETIKISGTGGYFWVRGNIISFDVSTLTFSIRVKTTDNRVIEISNWELRNCIRLWVR